MYYCRLYDQYDFPSINGTQLSIGDSRIDPNNPSCLSNRSSWFSFNLILFIFFYLDNITEWKYLSNNSIQSSIEIFGGSLLINTTYQFMVTVINRLDPTIQASGYLIVQVENTSQPLIALA
jgi:hypothetical protein